MLASRIEATLLKNNVPLSDFDECAAKAVELGCRALIIPTSIIDDEILDVQQLRYRDLRIGTVFGFPLGNEAPKLKREAMRAYAPFVDDMDVVLNINWIMEAYHSNDWSKVHEEIAYICDPSKYPYTIKLIIEAPLLNQDQIVEVCTAIVQEKPNYPALKYIKTATGYNGVTEEKHVKPIRFVLGRDCPDLRIKVSGGVRTLGDLDIFDPYDIESYGVGYPNFIDLIKEYDDVQSEE